MHTLTNIKPLAQNGPKRADPFSNWQDRLIYFVQFICIQLSFEKLKGSVGRRGNIIERIVINEKTFAVSSGIERISLYEAERSKNTGHEIHYNKHKFKVTFNQLIFHVQMFQVADVPAQSPERINTPIDSGCVLVEYCLCMDHLTFHSHI